MGRYVGFVADNRGTDGLEQAGTAREGMHTAMMRVEVEADTTNYNAANSANESTMTGGKVEENTISYITTRTNSACEKGKTPMGTKIDTNTIKDNAAGLEEVGTSLEEHKTMMRTEIEAKTSSYNAAGLEQAGTTREMGTKEEANTISDGAAAGPCHKGFLLPSDLQSQDLAGALDPNGPSRGSCCCCCCCCC